MARWKASEGLETQENPQKHWILSKFRFLDAIILQDIHIGREAVVAIGKLHIYL
jgi:hypothetical protein